MLDQRIRRNEPCPCGSGKKFKKCCLLLESRTMTYAGQAFASPTPAILPPPPAPSPSRVPPGPVEQDVKRQIRGTPDHPVYVYGKGWTPLGEVRPGDWLRTDNGWVEVSDVGPPGPPETAYNLRVEGYHTYFVGSPEWGFGIWVHNECHPDLVDFRRRHDLDKIKPKPSQPIDSKYSQTVARVRLTNGQSVYGVNLNIGEGSGDKRLGEALRDYRLWDGKIREANYNRLKAAFPGEFKQHPQFLSHAEFTALYLASQKGPLPAKLKMDTDRALCAFDDGCTKNLNKVLDWFGVKQLYLRNAAGGKSVPSTPIYYQPPSGPLNEDASAEQILKDIWNGDESYWGKDNCWGSITLGPSSSHDPTLVIVYKEGYGYYLELQEAFSSGHQTYIPIGSDDYQDVVKVWVGQNFMRFPRALFVTRSQAAVIVETFCRTGQRTPEVAWVRKRDLNWVFYDPDNG